MTQLIQNMQKINVKWIKNSKPEAELRRKIGRKSLLFVTYRSKNAGSIDKFQFNENETAKSFNSIGLKKSFRHFNAEFDSLFVPAQSTRKLIKSNKPCTSQLSSMF